MPQAATQPANHEPESKKAKSGTMNDVQKQIDKMDEERAYVDNVNRVMDFMTDDEKQDFANLARDTAEKLEYAINRNSLEALLADYPEPEPEPKE